MQTAKRHVKRVGIAIVGGIVLLVGIIAIPYPGPGWLIVFAGLAILATEFAWAQSVLEFAKDKYDRWQEWLKRQPVAIRVLVLALTGAVIILTLWLLNIFGMADKLFGLHQSWLHSPLPFFSS